VTAQVAWSRIVEASRLKRLMFVLALLGAASSARAAGGMALRWGSCEGTSNRNFACDASSGSELLVASFSPPSGVSALTGVAAIGHISAADSNVPAWWQMAPGGCRGGSLSASFAMGDQTECDDPWQGQGIGGIAAIRTDAQGVYFKLGVAVPQQLAQPVSSGRTYAAFKLIISHRGTTSSGGCTGCSTPMCITLDAMTLAQPNTVLCNENCTAENEITLTDGISGMGGISSVVTWQGGTPRCGAGAAKPATWSELKKRFR
jgi:hypothetical protein